jgi:hypothetical protein
MKARHELFDTFFIGRLTRGASWGLLSAKIRMFESFGLCFNGIELNYERI